MQRIGKSMSLEDALVEKLACFCCGQTEGDTFEVVCYGLELIVETVCKCACLLLLAAMLHKLTMGVALLLCFCPLRAQMGGIHCKTNIGCTAVMFLLLLAALFLSRFSIPRYVPILLFLFELIVCLLFAPSAGETNPITDPRIRRKKKCCAALILAILAVVSQIPMLAFAIPCICVSCGTELVSVLLLEWTKHRSQTKKKSGNPA